MPQKLTADEYEVLRLRAKIISKEYPSLRFGQCLFNLLHRDRPELADTVRGTNSDPFYAASEHEDRVERFKNEISESY